MERSTTNSSEVSSPASDRRPDHPGPAAVLGLLSQSDLLLLVLDEQLRVRWFSQRMARNWGLSTDVVGRHFGAIAADWNDEAVAADTRDVLEGHEPRQRLIRDADGRRHVCRIQATETEGAARGLVLSFSPADGPEADPTGVSSGEHQQLQEAVQNARRAALEAHAAKDQFLASVSHELRTPLSAIVLWARLLGQHGADDEQQLGEGVTAIKRSAEELRVLIDSLVDASRLARGKLQLEFSPVELGAIARSALEAAQAAADEKRVKLSLALDPAVGMVRADGQRLAQVIQQLLGNALKFTPSGGHVALRIERQDEQVEIRVTDTGEGISAAALTQVFTAGSGDRSGGGLGLGLSVARQLIELHGGSLRAASEGVGHGSVFTALLPLPALDGAGTPEIMSTEPTEKPLAGLRLLLVEDAAETRRALTLTLSAAGAHVTAVDSSSKALTAFREHRPDLIVSDLGLPKMDGYDLLRQFRRWEQADGQPAVPAMALTAYAGERVSRRALQSGFQLCLTKPVQPTELIAQLLGLRRGQPDGHRQAR